jgi:hypothetical protein
MSSIKRIVIKIALLMASSARADELPPHLERYDANQLAKFSQMCDPAFVAKMQANRIRVPGLPPGSLLCEAVKAKRDAKGSEQ